jgi:hypothetical protein
VRDLADTGVVVEAERKVDWVDSKEPEHQHQDPVVVEPLRTDLRRMSVAVAAEEDLVVEHRMDFERLEACRILRTDRWLLVEEEPRILRTDQQQRGQVGGHHQ